MKKIFALILSLLMVFSCLTACASKDDGQEEANDNVDNGPQDEVTPAPADWTEADATESIVYLTANSVTTLDKWAASSNQVVWMISNHIFDPVLNRDEEGNIVPSLATDWDMAEDNSKVTLYLRDDVYFTNGEHFTADDLIFTLERIRDDSERLPDSVCKNWRNALGELEKVSDYEMVINFKQPMPTFWYMICMPNLQVLCKKTYEELGYDAYWEKPVGSGAFEIVTWDPANSICELTIRSDEHGYWGYGNGAYTNIKNITIKHSPESNTRASALRTGEAQYIDNVASTDKELLSGEGFDVEKLKSVNYTFIQVACAEGDILADASLCEAFSLCIDRQLIVDTIMDGDATASIYPWREGDLGWRDVESIVYDPEKAAELVENSDYDGTPLKLIFNTSNTPFGVELSQALQSMAGEVGINIEVVQQEVAIYNDSRADHDYDICIASIADDGNVWNKIATSTIGSDRFNTGLQDTYLKELGTSLNTIMNEEEMDEIYAEIAEIATTTFQPNIYLFWPQQLDAYDSGLSGIQYHSSAVPDLTYAVIE